MKSEELPLTFFGNLDKDFKAEVMAAEMVEQGIPADRILILLTGAMKRSLRKDVEAFEVEESEHDYNKYFIVKTPREGLYDMLPEGLFHHPSAHRSAKTEKEIIKAMKQRKEEERKARQFFLPFEASINYLRMQMALYENRLDKRTYYNELSDIFKGHWEIFRHIDGEQADLFLHLIPILHDIRDNHPVLEIIMEIILGLPVQIGLRTPLPMHRANPVLSTLGDSTLGVDFSTGNELYDEGVDEILVKVGPMSNEVFQQFMPGGKKQLILELLCDYFLPVHVDIATEFVLDGKYRTIKFDDGLSHINSVLGSDTYL